MKPIVAAVRERVAAFGFGADVRYDAFGTDVIVNVDEEDLSSEGLLALRANAILADDDPVLLNNLHVYTDARPAKRARTGGAPTLWMNRMTVADAILDE